MNPKHYSDMRQGVPPQNPTRDELFEWSQKYVVLEEERRKKRAIIPKKEARPTSEEIDDLLVKYLDGEQLQEVMVRIVKRKLGLKK